MRKPLLPDVLAVLFFCAIPAQASWTHIQACSANTTSPSPTITCGSAVGAGHLLVVSGHWNDNNAPAITITSITDSAGDSFSNAVGPINFSGTQTERQQVKYAFNTIGGNTTVSVALSGTPPDIGRWFVDEYSQIVTASNPLDVTASATGNSSSASSGSATPTVNGDLIYGFIGFRDGSVSAGSGFTSRTILSAVTIAEDQPQTVAASIAATATSGASPWGALMATFKSTGAPPPPVINTTLLPNGAQTIGYFTQVLASGGIPPLTLSITSGALPSGVSMDTNGVFSGTASAAQTANFTVTVTDSASSTASQAYTVKIAATPTYDTYGGLVGSACSGGVTGLFYVEKAPSKRWRFCSPLGNTFFLSGVYVVATRGSNLAKYSGSTDTYRQDIVKRMKGWNWNTISIYWGVEMPPIAQDGNTANPQQLPFVHFFGFTLKSLINRFGAGSQPVKTLGNTSCTSPPAPHVSCNHALSPNGNVLDYYDPVFTTYVNNFSTSTFQNVGTYPADFPNPTWTNGKQWVIGFVPEDSDNTSSFAQPGPEFPGRDGTIGQHAGHVIATAAPVQTNNSSLTGCLPTNACTPYADNVVYSKNAWRDYLIGKYTTVGALNTAWGSNYTTFGVNLGYPKATTGSLGVLDEDGSSAWIGTDLVNQSGMNANVKTDVDAFLQLYAGKFYNVSATGIKAANGNMLVFSNAPMNSHAGMSRRPVIRAAGQYLDVLDTEYDSTRTTIGQQTYLESGRPAMASTYWTASGDSPASATGIQNPYQDNATQNARGRTYMDAMLSMVNLQGLNGDYPYIGQQAWDWDEGTGAGAADFGQVTFIDNAYDGHESVSASVACSPPVATLTCGSQSVNYGTTAPYYLGQVTTANIQWLSFSFVGAGIPVVNPGRMPMARRLPWVEEILCGR